MENCSSKPWNAEDGRAVTIIDNATGEIIDDCAYLTEKRVPAGRDYWWRFLVCDLINVMEELPGKQIHAIGTILDNVSPYDNTIQKTQEELALDAHVSRTTMNSAMGILQEHGIIKKVRGGLWMIDPHFMSQGGTKRKFDTLAIRYDSLQSDGLRVVEGGLSDERQDIAQ